MSDEFNSRVSDKTTVSSRIGETVRFIGFGLVAVFYTLQTGGEEKGTIPEDHFFLYMAIGCFGVITIIFDYLQYLAGYFAAGAAIKRSDSKYAYNKNWISYRLRVFFFWAKQFSAALGAAALAATMLIQMLIK